jgi:N-acetylmuramoyl-L-alanine amidase
LSVVAAVPLAVSAAFTFQDTDVLSSDAPNAAAVAAAEPVAVEVEPAPRLWTRPEGPFRIALQAGHWKAAEAPDEQAGLRTNGTRGGGKAEWEVNLAIAQLAGALLQEQGYLVEILPTTIPPAYWADVFVSIHADGNPNTALSGFRAAAPRRDYTGLAENLVDLLETSYADATGLRHYPTVTRRMRNYYAFNSRRYRHSLHPMTVGVILETGFLTSPSDRRVLLGAPERAARGIADAVVRFVETAPLQPRYYPAADVVSQSWVDEPRRTPLEQGDR